ncbi:MAG TPA: hypothetical protein VGI83_07800 [Gemmatimonadales bacterium]
MDELAVELSITDNAVRAQLQGLEKDALVRPAGSRRGGGAGKPPRLFELTPEADARLSQAFAPFLDAILASAEERLPGPELETLLADVGVRLARAHPAPSRGDRVAHAVKVIAELGGSATATREGTVTTIAAAGCALGQVALRHPDACRAMRALLQELTGRPVEECCDRGERAKCRFVVQENG